MAHYDIHRLARTYDNRGVRFVSRLHADIRITLKKRGGRTYRIELSSSSPYQFANAG